MSHYKGHVWAGLAAFVPLALILYYGLPNPPHALELVFLLSLCLLGSVFPDVDIKSKSQRLVYRIVLFGMIVLLVARKVEAAALLGVYITLPLVVKHRGWTHSRWAAFVIPIPLLMTFSIYVHEIDFKIILSGVPYYLSFLMGYLSHLAMDGMLLRKR